MNISLNKIDKILFLISIVLFMSIFLFPFFNTIDRTIRLFIVFFTYFSFGATYYYKFQNYFLFHFLLLYLLVFLLSSLLYLTQWSQYIGYFEKIYNYSMFFVPLIIIQVLNKYKIKKLIEFTTNLILIIYIINLFTTFFGLITYPLASRELASGQNLQFYSSLNIGGFGFIYSLIFLGVYVMSSKLPIFIRLVFWFFSLLVILMSQYSIALILFSFTIFLINRKIDFKKFTSFLFIVLIAFVIGILFFREFLISNFLLIGDLFDFLRLNFVSEKLRDFVLFLDNNDFGLSWELRFIQYNASINSFFNNIFFGSLFSHSIISGGHSEILDLIGSLGFFGVFLVYLVLVLLKKLKIFNLKPTFSISIVFLILIAIFNPISSFPQIMIMFLITQY